MWPFDRLRDRLTAYTDPESTFVASACECGVAVRDDGCHFSTALRLCSGTEVLIALKTKSPDSSAGKNSGCDLNLY